MSKIAWLEKQIDSISGFLAEDEARLHNKPDDFGLRLVIRNKRQHVDTLKHDLMLAQAERDREVMELRLISPALDRGAIPLRLLGKLADPLHKFLAGAAYHIRHGKDATRGIPSEWTNLIDLRLAGLGYGSTRLFLTGNVSPDLAGDSALQDSLDAAFSLLNSGPDGFYDALHRLGPAAVKGLLELLHEMESANTAAEFAWTSPDDKQHRWEGRLDEIVRLRATLESAEANAEVATVSITGAVTLLSVTGRIELVPEGEQSKIKIIYPKGNPDWVAGISLHQRITVVAEKTSWHDITSGNTLSRYALAQPISS